MKVRFSVDEHGQLADRDGRVLGRLSSLTLDVPNSDRSVGTTGGDLDFRENHQRQQPTTNPVSPNYNSITGACTLTVWAHYVRTFDSKAVLNSQRRRVIEQALKDHTVEECCRAITGLSRSPHHNGQNEQQTKYLDIRYALRGNGARGESNDERISKMAQLASLPALETVAEQETNERQRRLEKELGKLEEFPESELRPGDIARRDELRALRAEIGS